MKWWFSFLFAIGCVGVAAQSTHGVEFDSYTYDFGVIDESAGVVSHTFAYRNVGTKPYVITEVAVSCGCTDPVYSREPLKAGGSAEFTVRFDPKDRPGRFEKAIQIASNEGTMQLIIRGTVTPRPRTVEDDFPYPLAAGVRASELMLRVNAAPRSRAITRTVELVNTSITTPVTVAIDGATLPPWLSAVVSSTFIGAGERTQITLRILSADLWGKERATVGVVINGVLQAEKIHLEAIFVDDFSRLSSEELRQAAHADFSSYFYHFSTQKTGSSVSRDFKIKNSGMAPLHIRHIEGSSAAVRWSIDKQAIAPGAVANLRLTLLVDEPSSVNESVTIICSDPTSPVREIRLLANGI